MRPASSILTSVSKISRRMFSCANEADCDESAGSSEVKAARVVTCSVPPYCGRASARAISVTANTLLTASHRQSKSFIVAFIRISRHYHRGISVRLGPHGSDRSLEIHRRADRHRLTIRKLVRADE